MRCEMAIGQIFIITGHASTREAKKGLALLQAMAT